MSLFDNLIRYGIPFVPKPIVGTVVSRIKANSSHVITSIMRLERPVTQMARSAILSRSSFLIWV